MKPIAILLPLVLFCACSESVVSTNTTMDPASTARGVYKGKMVLHWVDGSTHVPQAGGTITIDGKAYATTDSSGNYIALDVPAGTHTLAFTKPGYDTAMILGDRYIGDTSELPDQHIELIPYDSLVIDSMSLGFRNVDSVSYLTILCARSGFDAYILFASVKISRVTPRGDTVLLASDLLHVNNPTANRSWIDFEDSPILTNPKQRLVRNDKVIISIRAASAPIVSSPVTYSPYVTTKQVIIK